MITLDMQAVRTQLVDGLLVDLLQDGDSPIVAGILTSILSRIFSRGGGGVVGGFA